MAMNNSLAEVHPELVSEWSEKNLTLTPDDITFGSNKKVWWRGACGHEWQTSVKARSNGEKCPICSGARVIAGINDLATLEPLLVKQWSKKNKIKPTEVSIGFHKKVIWRREKGHEWEVAVKSRTINKNRLPALQWVHIPERPDYPGIESAARRIADLEREVKQREQNREHSSLKERLEENKRIVAERERENAHRPSHDRGMSR